MSSKKKSSKKKSEPKVYSGMQAAEKLLAVLTESLDSADEILETTREWSDDQPPPLLKCSASYKEAVDRKTFKKFKNLLCFMVDALFGVDCDHDSAVRYRLVDLAREENFLPHMTVPRLGFGAPIDKQLEQLSAAKSNLAAIQERVKLIERLVDEDLKTVVQKLSISRRAHGCKTCKGKGWIETTKETWFALDYGERCRTSAIGCNYRQDSTGPFRVFCECQKSEDDDTGEDD